MQTCEGAKVYKNQVTTSTYNDVWPPDLQEVAHMYIRIGNFGLHSMRARATRGEPVQHSSNDLRQACRPASSKTATSSRSHAHIRILRLGRTVSGEEGAVTNAIR